MPESGAIDVAKLLEEGRWTGYLKFLVALVALTIIFDGAEIQLLALTVPSLMDQWSVPRGAFAPVFAIGLVGMMIGGALGGYLGDRLGRKTALIGCVFTFGAMTLAISFPVLCESVFALGVWRFLAGLGLGGAMPNAAALTSEYVPRRQRPIAVTLTIVCVPLGGMLASAVAEFILPKPGPGWRNLFLIGGAAPLAWALVLTQFLAESPRFLSRHSGRWPQLSRLLLRAGHAVPADCRFTDATTTMVRKRTIGSLLTPDYLRDTLGLWCAFFACLLAVYAHFNWIPALLAGAGRPNASSSGLFYFNLGGVVGAVGGALAISRVGSKLMMLTLSACAVVTLIVFSTLAIDGTSNVVELFALFALSGTMINGVQTTMYALAAHVYPVENRATGVGMAAAIGRVGGLASTYLTAWALDLGGSRAFFILSAAAMIMTFVGLAVIRWHVQRDNRG